MAMLIDTAFNTAHENMSFDQDLAQYESGLWIRLYRWPTPGITYPKGREESVPTWGIDHSERPSGGGILFHSPNALVLGIAADISDPHFPKAIKDKLQSVTQWIAHGLKAVGIPARSYCALPDPTSNEPTYCNTYHNPYELQYKGEKVTALAVRRWRHRFLIQGIIHTRSNRDFFSHLTAPRYLSGGLGLTESQIDDLESILRESAKTRFTTGTPRPLRDDVVSDV